MKKTKKNLLLSVLLLSPLLAEELEEIVVTPTNSTQRLGTEVSVTEVLTADDIKERGYTTVLQALRGVAGFCVTQNGGLGTAGSLYLRGMDSKATLMLIDGIRYNDITGLNGANFENLLVDDIERIEIVKGAQSGVWGADASAGVINIITKKQSIGLHGGIGVEVGSFKERKYNGFLSYKGDRFYLNVYQTWLESDSFSTMMPKGAKLNDLEDDPYKNRTTTIKTGVDFGKYGKVDAKYIDIKADVDGDGFDPITYMADPNSLYDSKSSTKLGSINYNYKDEKNEINLYAKGSRFKREYPQGWTKLFEGEDQEIGANYKRAYRDDDFVIVGLTRDRVSEDDSIVDEYKSNAFYLTNYNHFTNPLGKSVVTESIRHDRFSAFKNKTTAKIGIEQSFSQLEGLKLSVNYGTAYSVPSLYQLYAPSYGSVSLNPQESKSLDLSIKYRGFKAAYFRNRIKDMIDFDMATSRYINIDAESKIDGVELSFGHAIGSDFYLSTNYTHLINAENSQGKDLGRRAKDVLNLTLDYYGIESLHLGAGVEYTGERYDKADKQGEQTGKYTLVNLTADYEVDDNWSVYIKVENATDKEYQSVDGYSSSPRAFYAGVRARF